MRFNAILLAAFLAISTLGLAQETLRDIPPRAIELYPTLEDMHGYAIGQYGDYLVIFGGSIRSRVGEQQFEDFPNLDILLIDFKRRRASAYANSSNEGPLGEQMSATGLSYHQQGNTLYLLGGYGYSESHQQYITFPYITVVDLAGSIQALLDGENPVVNFYQLCDDRMAIFDAEMDYNGEEFFLINGKFAYKVRPFSEQSEYTEQPYQEEVRTFKLLQQGGSWSMEGFQTWYDLDAFRDYYGTLIPDRIEEELRLIEQRRGRQGAQ